MDSEPVGIFVYGTLRPEFIKTTHYCKLIHANTISQLGILKDGQLYYDGRYPYVIKNIDSITHGYLIFPENMEKKIKECDYVEHEGSLYVREIMTAIVNDEEVKAYVYIRKNITNECILIEHGDYIRFLYY